MECEYDRAFNFKNHVEWLTSDEPAAQMDSYWHKPQHGGWNYQEVALYLKFQLQVHGKWWNQNYWEYIKQLKYGDGLQNFDTNQKHRDVVQNDEPAGSVTAYRATIQVVWFRPSTDPTKGTIPAGQVTDRVRTYTANIGGTIQGSCRSSYGAAWSQQAAQSPPGTSGTSMAYDSATRQLILFGGYDDQFNDYGQTWTWDGSNWTLLKPAHSPPARDGASMSYDPGTGQLVLFGGENSTGSLSDTWIWNGSDWTQMNVFGPPGRSGAAMAYDPKSKQLVLFGGANDDVDLSDTWTWDGRAWNSTSASGPLPTDGPVAAYDPQRGGLVLFGGYEIGTLVNDTWLWSNGSWTRLASEAQPSARALAAMTYDPALRAPVMFGGCGPGTTCPGGTWTLSSTGWVKLSTVGAAPRGRQELSMAYDSATRQLVFFGGNTGPRSTLAFFSDTWTWST